MFNQISLFRAALGISRRELAERVNVNVQTIGAIERGNQGASLELGMRIAAVFGAPVEQVFSFTPFEPIAEIFAR